MFPAPIALFAYNRPDHVRRTLEALAANHIASGSLLEVFCDGPKEGATDEDETGLLANLAAHNAKEEHILYPAIDQQPSAPERDGVFVQMGKG